ncbi:hypothetical protein TREAZ_3069 [Leadbettera azotonutricia ZAS-9]|uniref:Uncharacterized protein n=1 Tax=Leadbettera azotonutricia (strain ATCC BAA-888 / DSM 13862 / ZAS-9) TaxID=545695 RepID=F5YAJ8_LEAAZ|nr:hypothetical protein TREAZ_3069 [Leadbettera azotonutricia ZAS-9]
MLLKKNLMSCKQVYKINGVGIDLKKFFLVGLFLKNRVFVRN